MHLFVKVYSPIYNVHTFLYWGCVLQTKRQLFITVYYTIGTICTPYIPYESYKTLFNVRIFPSISYLKDSNVSLSHTYFKIVQACSIF